MYQPSRPSPSSSEMSRRYNELLHGRPLHSLSIHTQSRCSSPSCGSLAYSGRAPPSSQGRSSSIVNWLKQQERESRSNGSDASCSSCHDDRQKKVQSGPGIPLKLESLDTERMSALTRPRFHTVRRKRSKINPESLSYELDLSGRIATKNATQTGVSSGFLGSSSSGLLEVDDTVQQSSKSYTPYSAWPVAKLHGSTKTGSRVGDSDTFLDRTVTNCITSTVDYLQKISDSKYDKNYAESSVSTVHPEHSAVSVSQTRRAQASHRAALSIHTAKDSLRMSSGKEKDPQDPSQRSQKWESDSAMAATQSFTFTSQGLHFLYCGSYCDYASSLLTTETKTQKTQRDKRHRNSSRRPKDSLGPIFIGESVATDPPPLLDLSLPDAGDRSKSTFEQQCGMQPSVICPVKQKLWSPLIQNPTLIKPVSSEKQRLLTPSSQTKEDQTTSLQHDVTFATTRGYINVPDHHHHLITNSGEDCREARVLRNKFVWLPWNAASGLSLDAFQEMLRKRVPGAFFKHIGK